MSTRQVSWQVSFGGCSHVYRAAEWSLDSLCSCTCLNVEPSVTLIHLFGSRSVNIFYARIVLNESLFCVPIAVLNRKNSFPTAAFGNWLKFMKTPACVLGTEGQTFHQGGQGNPGHRRQLALGEPTWLDLEPHQFWPPVFSSLTSVLCFLKWEAHGDHCGIRTIHVKCLNYGRQLGFF